MKIMLLNGPNLNMTGTREPNIYGRTGYEEMMRQVQRAAQSRGHEVTCFQSNHEGALIDEKMCIRDSDSTARSRACRSSGTWRRSCRSSGK